MPTGIPKKEKQCIICNELFVPESPAQKICRKKHYTKCPICGKEMEWNTTSEPVPCSKECKKILRKNNNMKKYGVEHPMQLKSVQDKHRKTMVERYGVESPLQNDEIKAKAIKTNQSKFGCDWAIGNPEIRKNLEQTMIERYGAPTTMQSDILNDKMRKTMVERYGVENPMQSDEIKERIKNTNLERYGVENPMQSDEISSKMSTTRKLKFQTEWKSEFELKCKDTWIKNLGVDNPSKSPVVIDKITNTFLRKYGVKRAINVPEFRKKMIDTMIDRYGVNYYVQSDSCYPSSTELSKTNLKFAELLDEHHIEYSMEFAVGTKSYDFVIPENNTLIEINPTYTHNIIGNHWNNNGIPADYHINKSKLAKDNGYRCIHIFDWDNKDKIINMLLPKTTIYARKCEIYKLTNDTLNKFLNMHHLQNTCKGQLLSLGLVYDNDLVQVMTFGKPRYNKNYSIELLRLCTDYRYRVIGGASKLIKFAIDTYELNNIISYCDVAKFSGDVYETIGMKYVKHTPPQEIWSKGHQKITANMLRMNGYDRLFNTNYGKEYSNDYLMLENGWLPVFDCGQYIYEFRI